MKDTIYIVFNKNGIRSLTKRTKTFKSLPSDCYLAELNLEVDSNFFDDQIPKFNIKLNSENILKPEIKIEEHEKNTIALFFSRFD